MKERIIFNVLTIIFKLTRNLLPDYLTNILTRGRNIHHHGTRRVDDLRVAPFTMASTQKSIYYRGIRIYNSLPADIKTVRTMTEFKRGCAQWIRTQAF